MHFHFKGMDNSNNQSVDSNANMQSSSASSRGKSDPAWQHVSLIQENGKPVYTCMFCLTRYKGGGINRMKQHLAGKQGQISSCKKVPHDIKCQMMGHLELVKQNKNDKESFGDDYDEAEVQEVQGVSPPPPPTKVQSIGNKGKRKASASQDNNYFAPRTTPGSQPTLKSVFASKEVIKKAKMSIARWFFDAAIPFNAIQSPYFQAALDAVAAIGPGFKAPTYDELRVHLLGDCKKECQLLVDSYRSSWKDSGCTLMADGWSDQRQRTLINFLVYCPAGMSFVKSIDASDMVKNATTLLNLFVDVIEWVGPDNIVHVVTDNAANYVAAGRLIHEKYGHIFWSPCAAHCLNLILKDIGSMPHVANLAFRASKITVFVYNHMVFLSWLRKRPGWKEIVRPGLTRFATVFLTLKSIYEHKEDLQALVVDKHFTGHKLGRSANGKVVNAIVLDSKFWHDCCTMVKVAGPLIRLLRIVDADERPSLGYVYEGMQRAKKAIKKMFNNKKNSYKSYTEIIKTRWDKHLHRNLHAASYFLNPAFFYDENFIEKHRIMQGLLDLLDIKSLCSEPIKAMKEIQVYRDRKESFDRPNVIQAAKSLKPGKQFYMLICVNYLISMMDN